jgi:hypothetical protein
MVPRPTEEEIIQDLIFEVQTAATLAWVYQQTEEIIHQIIEQLLEKGLVAPVGGSRLGDVRCTICGAEYEREYELPRDPCQQCGGYVEDGCKWFYIGGPISEALAAVA